MIITLTTDFGLTDPFVAMMKGVIYGIAPGARLVDITHNIESYDATEAAFLIDRAYRYFPAGTIHIVVVDPGVGTSRRPIAAAAEDHIFVGPDNGVLSFVLYSEPEAPVPPAYHITNRSLFNASVSNTFHGRDIFAPVAAHLAQGAPLESVGPRIIDFMRKAMPSPRLSADGSLMATVLRVDKFGNIVTNVRREYLSGNFAVRVGGVEIRRLLSNYAAAEPGEFFAIEGSTGYIELSLNQGSAAEKLRLARGAEFEVETGRVNH